MIVSRVGKPMNLKMGLLNHHIVLRHLIWLGSNSVSLVGKYQQNNVY